MADIVPLPTPLARFCGQSADEISIVNAIARVSSEIAAIQSQVAVARMDATGKVVASRALLAALGGLHTAAFTMQTSLSEKAAPTQAGPDAA